MLGNTRERWGSISRAFHWTLAVLLLGMIGFGWWMNHIPTRPDKLFYRTIHADIGYIVLLLMVLRLIWRLMNPVPADPAGEPTWMKIAAKLSHGALYLVAFAVALMGWAHSGAHKPTYASFFGWFDVPQFTSENRANAGFYEDVHIYLAYVLLALAAIHAVAAVYHHVVRRDDVMKRMVIGEG